MGALIELVWNIAAIILLLGVLVQANNYQDCGCEIMHPQELYCSSDAALVGFINKVEEKGAISVQEEYNHGGSSSRYRRSYIPHVHTSHHYTSVKYLEYTVYVLMTFLGKDIVEERMQNRQIKITSMKTGCEQELKPRQLYFFTATVGDMNNNLAIDKCDWVKCWSGGLTTFQRRVLVRGGYDCSVHVIRCEKSKCKDVRGPDSCIWRDGSVNDCYSKNAKCRRSKSGQAKWRSMKRCRTS